MHLSFFEQMILARELKVDLSNILLSPIDCLSLHYFFSLIRTVTKGQIDLNMSGCWIDDQGLSLIL